MPFRLQMTKLQVRDFSFESAPAATICDEEEEMKSHQIWEEKKKEEQSSKRKKRKTQKFISYNQNGEVAFLGGGWPVGGPGSRILW